MNITEKMIDEAIGVMKEHFTMPDYAILHSDYVDKTENPITKIHGIIQPNDLDDLQETYNLSVTQIIDGLENGKYESDDGACWWDKEAETINSCSESTVWDWLDRDFARYVLSIADHLENYALYEIAEEKLKAIAAENPTVKEVEDETEPENLTFTERELEILSTALEQMIDAAYNMKILGANMSDSTLREIRQHITELENLSFKLNEMAD